MHRSLWGVPLRFIVNVYSQGCENVYGKSVYSTTFSSLRGYSCFKDGGESMAISMQVQIINALYLGERNRASYLLSEIAGTSDILGADSFKYILHYCAKSPDPLFAMETWGMMEEKKVTLRRTCCFRVVESLCKGGYIKEAFNLILFLGENHGMYPSLGMYNNFLGACAKRNRIKYANKCLDLMDSRMEGKNEKTYSVLLKLAVLQRNLSAVHDIWKECSKVYSLTIITLGQFVWAFSILRDLAAAYETLQRMVALAFQGSTSVKKGVRGRFYISKLDIPIPLQSQFGLKKCSFSGKGIFLGMENSEAKGVEVTMLKDLKRNIPVMKLLKCSFNDVMRACARYQNYELAEKLIPQMQKIGLEPSCYTYDFFIQVVASKRGFSDAIEVLKRMQEMNLEPSNSTLATISVSCSEALELHLAEVLLDQLSGAVHPYFFNSFLEACGRLDQPERAVRILLKMKELKVKPNGRTYQLLFSMFGIVNAPYESGNMISQEVAAKRINAIQMDMVKNEVQHSYLSMMGLLQALGLEGMMSELMQHFRNAEYLVCYTNRKLGTHIYNTVLHSLVLAQDTHMAIKIFKNMKSCGFPPNDATYGIMSHCCNYIDCSKSVWILVSMMIRDGFPPDEIAYCSLVKAAVRYENFYEALNLIDRASLDGIQLDVRHYNTVLREAWVKGRIDVIELVVEKMHREKVQPDSTTCFFVFSLYLENGFFSTAIEALQVLSLRMISKDDESLQEKRRDYEDLILDEDFGAESRILSFFGRQEEDISVALLNLRWSAMIGYSVSWLPDESMWATRLSSNYNKIMKHSSKDKVIFVLN